MKLINGDALENLKELEPYSVDLILTDPPYGTIKGIDLTGWTDAKTEWDNVLDMAAIFKECNRVLKPNGALILFGQEPFTSKTITQAHGSIPFAYRGVWVKEHFGNALIVKKALVKYTEDIMFFFKNFDDFRDHPVRDYIMSEYDKSGLTCKKGIELCGSSASHYYTAGKQFLLPSEKNYRILQDFTGDFNKPYDELQKEHKEYMINRRKKYPRKFNLNGAKSKGDIFKYSKEAVRYHPTQKPVALLADLITTFSNEGDTVLDFTMGSGSTGVACVQTGRKFVGIELDATHYKTAVERVENA